MRAFLATVTCLLLAAVGLNAATAWSARRYERSFRAVATQLAPGQAMVAPPDLDDRRFQRVRLLVIPPPQLVAFGSSRMMPLSSATLGLPPGRFYNAAVTAASVEDHIALWYLLERGGRIPEAAVFSIDHWALAASQEDVRWLALAPEVARFLEAAGQPSGRAAAALQDARYGWTSFKELFSYTVLKSSLASAERSLRGRGRRGAEVMEALRRNVVPEERLDGRRGVRADGSLVYDRTYDRRPPEQVREEAVRFARAGARGLASFRVDPQRLSRLALLWEDMRRNGVEIVAYMPPYHPAAWALITADPRARAALAAEAAALRGLAGRTGVRFADASDPASIGCGEAMFYDGDHARAECLRPLIERLLGRPAARVLAPRDTIVAPARTRERG